MNVVAVVMAVSCLDCYRYSNPNHVGGEIQVLDGVLVAVVAVGVSNKEFSYLGMIQSPRHSTAHYLFGINFS